MVHILLIKKMSQINVTKSGITESLRRKLNKTLELVISRMIESLFKPV